MQMTPTFDPLPPGAEDPSPCSVQWSLAVRISRGSTIGALLLVVPGQDSTGAAEWAAHTAAPAAPASSSDLSLEELQRAARGKAKAKGKAAPGAKRGGAGGGKATPTAARMTSQLSAAKVRLRTLIASAEASGMVAFAEDLARLLTMADNCASSLEAAAAQGEGVQAPAARKISMRNPPRSVRLAPIQ